MMTLLFVGLPIVGLLPVMDLPFPLVIVGGVLLAIASNRTTSTSSIKESIHPQAVDSGTASPMPGGQNQRVDQHVASASPSLPNLLTKQVPSSQRSISPTISPSHGSQNTPKVTGETSAGPKHSSQSTDPKLPTFVSPAQKKKKGVSFTIENQDQ